MRISDGSSDVCSSDLYTGMAGFEGPFWIEWDSGYVAASLAIGVALSSLAFFVLPRAGTLQGRALVVTLFTLAICGMHFTGMTAATRSEEHTAELQSLMRISYAVFCLKKNNTNN